jgi:glycosyltransferase involved in cell wall biosynthesis
MKILYVQQHFATGRGEAGVRGYNLVRTLAARGHQVTVICGQNWRDSSLSAQDTLEVPAATPPSPGGREGDGRGGQGGEGPLVVEQDLEGFRIVQTGVYYSNHQSFGARLLSFLRFALLACRETVRRDADLVFASSTPLTVSLPALAARWLRGTPYVFEVRDLWPDLPIEMGILRNRFLRALLLLWEKVVYLGAWRLVALAPGIQEGIERKAGIPPSQILMVPNGADTAGLQPLPPRRPRTHLGLPDDLLVLGYAGTHGTANGLDAVLDAALVLRRRGVPGAAFALIGDGREKPRLLARAAAERLDDVHFYGLVSKATYNEVLAELDVGLQILLDVPGFRWGTSPNKFFDYLAAGRPVLVNYPGWMSALVTEHGCGLAVPPGDPEAFADAVEELLARRAELEAPGAAAPRLSEMGAAARELAEERFSQQRILVDLARFLEELKEGGP